MKMSKITFVVATISLYIISSAVLWQIHKANNSKILEEINSLYHERGSIDSNLRSQIVNLQKKIVNLPKIFTKNTRSILIEKITANFKIESSEKITSKEALTVIFSRNERKEIFSGKIVAQTVDNKLFYAVGLMDDNGEFTDSVERIQLQSKNVGTDFDKLSALINSDLSEENNKYFYEEKISLLKQICIDSAFDSEKTRLEFVSKENDITQINIRFIQAHHGYQKDWLKVVLAIFSVNALCFLVLAGWFARKLISRKNFNEALPRSGTSKALSVPRCALVTSVRK